MIKDEPHEYWIWVIPSSGKCVFGFKNAKEREEYLGHYGKWLIFELRERLDKLAALLDTYVERGEIDSAKYGRKPGLGSKVSVMCVYCDDRRREKVWEVLASFGVTKRIWKYDRQTLEDWAPGGRLREKAERLREL
jgi:hypothetical protein